MSSETLTTRTTVLRGAAAGALRGAAIGADLSLLRPASQAGPRAAAVDREAALREAREAAAQLGYEDGFAAGRQDAQAQADERARAAAEALDDALTALHAAAAALGARSAEPIADVEATIARTAVAIAEATLGRELRSLDEPGRDAVIRALQLAPDRVDVIARLHPADAATVGDTASLSADRAVRIVADESVERGGCIVDAGPCRIDAQIGPALARVRKVLGA